MLYLIVTNYQIHAENVSYPSMPYLNTSLVCLKCKSQIKTCVCSLGIGENTRLLIQESLKNGSVSLNKTRSKLVHCTAVAHKNIHVLYILEDIEIINLTLNITC